MLRNGSPQPVDPSAEVQSHGFPGVYELVGTGHYFSIVKGGYEGYCVNTIVGEGFLVVLGVLNLSEVRDISAVLGDEHEHFREHLALPALFLGKEHDSSGVQGQELLEILYYFNAFHACLGY